MFRYFWSRHMTNPNRHSTETYSEAEAAASLGITIAYLHEILDQHIFTQGNTRPESIEFTSNDLLLLSFWNKNVSLSPPTGRVLRMPKRR
ncbi:MAG: hypothetical protein WBM04_02715 [Candidatus Korobacteraceae bacterium]